MKSIYKLQGIVQHYNWGGRRFIPDLLQTINAEGKPFAEYWLGAHPSAASKLESGTDLQNFIQQHPTEVLGDAVAARFGNLPYLFKILDVAQMLSIQVHPSIESAVAGYEDEETRGISIKAPNRNYKDKNHKPEAMVALSDFWLLHGFKGEDALRTVLQSHNELAFLLPVFEAGGYEALYAEVMNMPQAEVNRVLAPVVERILSLYKEGKLRKDSEDFWAARAALHFCTNGEYDRGIFSIYLFNILHLKPNEGIYQPAGLPHAYLEGQNVEVMANSDNVLRAGLTDKHIEVPELMKHVKFEATHPVVIQAKETGSQVYATAAKEFEVIRHSLHQTWQSNARSATVLFVTDGAADLHSGGEKMKLKKGEAAFVVADTIFSLSPLNGGATVFAASTPG